MRTVHAQISTVGTTSLRQNGWTSALSALDSCQQSKLLSLAIGLQHILAKKMAPHVFTEPSKMYCE